MARHGINGLNLSLDCALPGFGPLHAAAGSVGWRVTFVPDLSVPDAIVVRHAGEPDNRDRLEIRRPHRDAVFLSYADGTRFSVDASTRNLDVSWRAPLTFEDALVYLVGPALGAALRLEGRTVLHASAVEVDGRAVLVMGAAGAGKSTLTAALVDRGFPLVTEDVSSLWFERGHPPAVFRGGARIKLWDESVTALRGRADALPALVPSNADWTKKYLDASAQMVTRDLTPIGGVLLLSRDATCTAPRIEDLTAHERLLALIANGYGLRVMRAADKEGDLARLATLARSVPIRRLVYPDSMMHLGEVVDLLARAC